MRHMHQVKGANPFALTIFCPCGVVQPTCLPLMQEITGAKPVRDANSYRPQSIVSDALPRYGSEPGAIPGEGSISQSSQRSSRHHKPAQPRAALGIATILPPRSSLRISFVKNSCRSITGWRLHPLCSRSPTQRHDVENVASAGASPAASTILACKH